MLSLTLFWHVSRIGADTYYVNLLVGKFTSANSRDNMARKSLEDDPAFESVLNCGICLDTLSAPKLLQCNHSFCQKCLQLWNKNNPSIRCPMCQRITQMPSGGIAALPNDFRHNQFVDCLREARPDIVDNNRGGGTMMSGTGIMGTVIPVLGMITSFVVGATVATWLSSGKSEEEEPRDEGLQKKKWSLIAMFMGPTWGPSGADRTQMDPMWAPWTLLSEMAVTGGMTMSVIWDSNWLIGPWKILKCMKVRIHGVRLFLFKSITYTVKRGDFQL